MLRTGRESTLTGEDARSPVSSSFTEFSCTDFDLRDEYLDDHSGLASVVIETGAGLVERKLLVENEALLGALENDVRDDGLGAAAVGRRRYLARL